MSPRSGMTAMPSARMRSGSDPLPARPTERSASGADPGGADHGEDVPTQAAQVRADDRHHRPRGDGRVGRGPTAGEDADTSRRGKLVCRSDHAAQAGPDGEGGERERHGPGVTARRRSAALRRAPCALKAASTWSMPIVSLTKRSRSSRPSR